MAGKDPAAPARHLIRPLDHHVYLQRATWVGPKTVSGQLTSGISAVIHFPFSLSLGMGLESPLSRKVSVRSVDDNTRRDVEAYVESQVGSADFADERFANLLNEFQVANDAVDLSQPAASLHGRYWYNLHLVLVAAGGQRTVDAASLRVIRDACLRIVAKKRHQVSRLAIIPDHLHMEGS